MNFPMRFPMRFPRSKSKRTGDPSQPETSEGPVRGAEEATEDEFNAVAVDVFGTGEPPQDGDAEQAASPPIFGRRGSINPLAARKRVIRLE